MPNLPTKREICGDCGVKIGELHVPGCDIERCPDCGAQAISCDCDPDVVTTTPRLPWTGEWPGDAECREFGWYCRLVPNRGWIPCGPDDPGAIEDLNRLVLTAQWDKATGRFVQP